MGQKKGRTPRERKAAQEAKELKRVIDGLPPKAAPVSVCNAAAIKGAGVRHANQQARKQLGRRRGKRF